MSKSTKIIAGAGVAALAIAAIPAVGSFAVDPAYTNNAVTYTATIEETLALKSSTATPDAEVLTNGGDVVSTATHTLTATTNHTSGYVVSAVSENSAAKLSSDKDDIAYGATAKGSSAWNLGIVKTSGQDQAAATNAIIGTDAWDGAKTSVFSSTKPTTTDGDVFTVTMNASADSKQAAGTYTDKITYTIAVQ